MIVLVTGGRLFADRAYLFGVFDRIGPEVSVVIQGGAKGADHFAELWARDHEVECLTVLPEPRHHGRSAPPKRNEHLVHLALRRARESGLEVVCFAFPGGYGTWHCAGFAESHGVWVHYFCPEADVDTPYGDYLRRIGR